MGVMCSEYNLLDKKSLFCFSIQSTDSFLISPRTDNTPEIVVNSLIEGGLAIRGVSHRLLLPLLACHCSDTEQPMLLFPKTSLGPLKQLLVRAREPKAGGMVSQALHCVCRGPGGHKALKSCNLSFLFLESP